MPEVVRRIATADDESSSRTDHENEAFFLRDPPRRRSCQTAWFRGVVVMAIVLLLAVVALACTVTIRNRDKNKTILTGGGSAVIALQQPEEEVEETMASVSTFLRIQIVSDLHIEFYGNLESVPNDIIIPRAPVLALLGDVGLSFTPLLKDFLHLQAQRFERVLFLAGNHEFYNVHSAQQKKTVDEQIQWIKDVCNERENLYYMEKSSMDLYGVRILATTLWSYIPPSIEDVASASMNDYHLSYVQGDVQTPLRKLSASDTSQWHAENVQWLETEITAASQINQPVLVLTHHTPSLNGTSAPRYDGNDLSYCFSSDLSHLLQAPVVQAWACGHTHWNFDLQMGNSSTRLFSNQRGYAGKESMLYNNEGTVLEFDSL